MPRLFLKLFRRRSMERDVEAELAFHRDMAAAHGNPIPMGNTALVQEQARDLCDWKAASCRIPASRWCSPSVSFFWWFTYSLRHVPSMTRTGGAGKARKIQSSPLPKCELDGQLTWTAISWQRW